LAEGPAKLIKQFRRNFERNSDSARMQELPSTEFHRNGIRGICTVPNDAQIERRRLPTLDLGIINPSFLCSSTTTTTIDDAHPPLPPHHRRLTASSRHHHHHPRPHPPTSITRNQHMTNDVAMPRHRTNKHRPRRHHNEEHNPHQKRRGNVVSPTERLRATSTPCNEGDSRVPRRRLRRGNQTTNDDIFVIRCCPFCTLRR
jgi:hypothetical protein